MKADYSLASPPILTILPLLDGLLTGKLPLSGEKETRQFLAAMSLKNKQNISLLKVATSLPRKMLLIARVI